MTVAELRQALADCAPGAQVYFEYDGGHGVGTVTGIVSEANEYEEIQVTLFDSGLSYYNRMREDRESNP